MQVKDFGGPDQYTRCMSDQEQHMHAMPAPRYGSYPGADRFSLDFGYRDYLKAVAGLRTRASARPLSLYLHIPGGKDGVYLGYLKREIEMQGRLFTGMNRIDQLHFGGGPTMLSALQMEDLMLHVRRCFEFAPDRVGEYAIEVDPHNFARERLASMRRLGFNRISMKVQVCDAQVRALVNAAREASFRSVSIGLAGGAAALLLAGVIGLGPDRIALDDWSQCGPAFKLLGDAGYVYLGMGDFARPGDDLAIAQKQGRLHCNFQGYSTHADTDQVACGVSAISAVAATYCQNVKTLDAYYDLIDRNELPIERGVRLDMDDVLRRTIIRMLMCQFELSMPCIEQAYPIVFAEYFAPELVQLQRLARDGLVTLDPEWLSVTPAGRVLIRTVCAVFDSHRAEGGEWTA
jgi:oxygen-independent coproporphyrinogen-3 oxidase